jgi:hypothetical protein
VNLPVGLLAQWMVRARVPDAPGVHSEALELPGAVTWTLGLVALMLGSRAAPPSDGRIRARPVRSPHRSVLLGTFALLERRAAAPLLPPSIVFGPAGLAALLTMLGQIASMGVGVHMPLYLEDVLGFDAAESGRLDGGGAGAGPGLRAARGELGGPLGRANRQCARIEPHGSRAAGAGVDGGTAVGFHLVAAMGLVGAGLGLFTVPNASALFGAVPAQRLGLASGLQGTMRNLGIALGDRAHRRPDGLALIALTVVGLLHAGQLPISRPALALATRDLYIVLAGVAAAGIALVLRRSADRDRLARTE